jgi:hypothetical protein
LTVNLPGYSSLADGLQAKASALTFKTSKTAVIPAGYKGGSKGGVVKMTKADLESVIDQTKADLNPPAGPWGKPTGKDKARLEKELAGYEKSLAEEYPSKPSGKK